MLADIGKSLRDYQLPKYSHNLQSSGTNRLLAKQLDYNSHQEKAMQNKQYVQLNKDQKHCFDIILDGVSEHQETTNFFVH